MRRFHNLDPKHRPHGMGAVLRWGVWERFVRRRAIDPPGPPALRVTPDLDLIHASAGPPRLTWIGHASFLGRLGGRSFLIDPVFSDRVGWVVRRFARTSALLLAAAILYVPANVYPVMTVTFMGKADPKRC